MKIKNLIIFWTRPEAIKMATLVKEFQKHPQKIKTKICIIPQHQELLEFFEITPDYDLDLLKPNQNLYTFTPEIITNLKTVPEEFQPDYVYVHGDTTTTMTASLTAFYYGAQVCHIEAGLRTFDMQSPFSEEMNRSVTGAVSNLHFASTSTSRANLLKENKREESIVITGNNVIDALMFSVNKVNISDFMDNEVTHLDPNKRFLLVTKHRRENHDQQFINICEALKQIAQENPDVQIVYPVHLNPNVQKPKYELLANIDNAKLISSLSYPAFV
jgi:UDP-N-acetylglucosamine 2-epimerase (non-hydrolysing)